MADTQVVQPKNGVVRDTILFVSTKPALAARVLRDLEPITGVPMRGLLVVPRKTQALEAQLKGVKNIDVISVNVDAIGKIEQKLKPYLERLLAATCHLEKLIPLFKRIIPHVPYLRTPTETSLEWATDKVKMRQMLYAWDKKLTPAFTTVSGTDPESIDKIVQKVGFPLIVKPSGLAQSLLVSQCYYREELEAVLEMSLKKIEKIYKEKKGRGKPQLLVEQMMEGHMYSIDAYVDSRGQIYFCPLVYVETGKAAGFDDFFGYKRQTPVDLKAHKEEAAQEATAAGIQALGLRSTTCHAELMRTEAGWKIIEIGPRMGGNRDKMYGSAFGINHALNDVLIRIPKKPILSKRTKGYSAVMEFYARKEGVLQEIKGLTVLEGLDSLMTHQVKKQVGATCRFARNGGTPVINVKLFNKSRPDLLADIRRLEQSLKIVVAEKKKA